MSFKEIAVTSRVAFEQTYGLVNRPAKHVPQLAQSDDTNVGISDDILQAIMADARGDELTE